jgi:hypothetical protein
MTMATSIFTGMIGKRKASHVWKFFGQMTTTILANNLSFDLLPLSEIRTKSKKMAWLPEPRSDLVSSSITSMLCVVWSRPLGKVRCRSPTTSKKSFAYAIYVGGPNQQSTSMPLLQRPERWWGRNGKKQSHLTKAILSRSQKKINGRCLRKLIYSLLFA